MKSTKHFFHTKLFTLLLLTTTGNIMPKLSDEAIASSYETDREGSWKYLEYIFIVQPTNTIETNSKYMLAGVFAVGSTAFLARTQLSELITRKENSFNFENSTSIASIVLAMTGFFAYYCKMEASVKHETLVNFLNNWSTHRNYIPEELTSAFDELEQAFQSSKNKSFSNAQVNEIFEIVQHLLEHLFEKRYPKKAADSLSAVKTITDIAKNIK